MMLLPHAVSNISGASEPETSGQLLLEAFVASVLLLGTLGCRRAPSRRAAVKDLQRSVQRRLVTKEEVN